ncbi:MAG: MOSC domain-containing protein [Nanoarchaeota archaeon]|nr:MOSC domain-containing protein [Nanoarchaeota archaeon]
MRGTIYQINKKKRTSGERGLPKLAVESAEITFNGIVGDFNKHRHEALDNDLEQALLLYMLETIKQLSGEGFPVEPGHLGENITTEGIPYVCYDIGKQYRIGEDVVIEISNPCTPCKNLRVLPYFESRNINLKKLLLNRRGWYARVLQEGFIRVGDTIEELVSE